MAGLGASFRGGFDEQASRDNLARTRDEQFKQMQQRTEITQNGMDRQKEQQDYQDQQRENALALLKVETKKVATQSLDSALLESAKGDFTKLNSVLTNNTEGNTNKEIKHLIESTLGGTVIGVRAPTLDDNNGEELMPDQVAVEIINPSGEKSVHLMSNTQLGIMAGTPNRVGTKNFHDHMEGKFKQDTSTDLAKKLSVSFDGQIKGLQENLLVAATVGGDKNASELLNLISETSTKDGDTLIKALTAEYGKAKTPEERKAIKDRLVKVSELMKKLNTKKDKGYKGQAEEKLKETISTKIINGENVDKEIEALKALQGASATPTKKTDKQIALEKEQKDKEALASVKPEDIANGVDPTEKLANAVLGKKDSDKRALAKLEVSKIIKSDAGRAVDPSNPDLRYGRLDEKGQRLLNYYKSIEAIGGGDPNSSSNKEAIKTIASAKSIVSNANAVIKDYDRMKEAGLFSSEQGLGVVTSVKAKVFKFFGDFSLTGDEDKDKVSADKLRANLTVGMSDMDRYNELRKIDNPNKAEELELSKIGAKLQLSATVKWDTSVYLHLKKLLQAISGQGVTNQELEAFKTAFSGNGLDALDSVMSRLNNSALTQMQLANTSYGALMTGNMPYSALKGTLDVRNAGAYLLAKHPDRDVNQGLQSRVHNQLELKNTPVYKPMLDKMARVSHMQPSAIEAVLQRAEDFSMHHGTKSYQETYKLTNEQYKKEVALMKMYNSVLSTQKSSNIVSQQPAPSTPPAQGQGGDRIKMDLTIPKEGR